MRIETLLLHNGCEFDQQTGASSVPIYQASTFHQFDVDNPGQYDYTRSGNPTRQALEDTIAKLEGGCRGFAFASGMAAISTVFLLLSKGDHLIVSQDVYGGTYRVLTQVLNRFGIDSTFVDTTDSEAIIKALQPNTRALYVETPSNPTLKVTDLGLVAKIAKEHKLLSIVDNTFLTPYYQQPLAHGIDIVVHSATKFLGGHSDVVAGLVAVKETSLADQIKTLQNAFGAVLGVQDSWLILRGIKTLQARLDVSTKNAGILAEWLQDHKGIDHVYYTGLPDHDGHHLQNKQASGHGAVLSFDVGSGVQAKQLLQKIRLPLVAVSLGAVESILSYPVLMSHAAMPQEVRRKHGITDGLLRFSVGLENVEDLIDDLSQALDSKVSFAVAR
ncbi:aminotransferase class I/II-fold pyridoxal phosphate-dependent enzyme [Shimazuella kribbensis]|uniref:aminotransferase class I/II-fold pyridoxal phosphate-dependent enzyme n=1 Tax=Shimazuella kribbensis TaxID=139808 RepID=UPI00048BFE86|nr:aminotransferase class I/II-fold pyridoxal phosphate-dependent enzyme [Shimazuella kribbensis]